MPQPRALLTAAVVSYDTRELLLRCLASLAADAEAGRAEVAVLDNASSDGSAEAVAEHAPWARLTRSAENLGFGPAVNRIAAGASTDWLLVANADVALEPGALDALLDAGADPAVGCVAPRLILPGGATEHSVHPFPTLPLTLAFNLGLHHLGAGLAEQLCLEGAWDPERPRAVPWAIGACLLIRRQAFEEVGGFDERQWMYAEDLDLGWRLHERGWRTRYAPAARVHHASGAATEAAFGEERAALFLAATYAMLECRRGPGRMWATAALNVAGAAGRVAWMTLAARRWSRWASPSAASRGWLTAHVHGIRGRSTLPHRT